MSFSAKYEVMSGACYHPVRPYMPVVLDPESRPDDPECPECGDVLVYVETEPSASGAFRTQADAMPKMAIHFYDCPSCGTCWKLGTRLLPDPVRQVLKR